jgi:hypothetical protein
MLDMIGQQVCELAKIDFGIDRVGYRGVDISNSFIAQIVNRRWRVFFEKHRFPHFEFRAASGWRLARDSDALSQADAAKMLNVSTRWERSAAIDADYVGDRFRDFVFTFVIAA